MMFILNFYLGFIHVRSDSTFFIIISTVVVISGFLIGKLSNSLSDGSGNELCGHYSLCGSQNLCVDPAQGGFVVCPAEMIVLVTSSHKLCNDHGGFSGVFRGGTSQVGFLFLFLKL